MDKELIKKLVAQGKAYVLDLRGGSVPYKEGNAAAVDFYCPQDVVLNMPWVKMGRGHINLHLGIELPKGVGLDIRSRSGFTDKGMEVDVAFIGKNETDRLRILCFRSQERHSCLPGRIPQGRKSRLHTWRVEYGK